MKEFFLKHEKRISKIAILVIFLALVRTISEPLRLQYYSAASLSFNQIKPFLIGGLVASAGLLVMTIFSFYSRHKIIIAISLLTIIALLIVKTIYLL